jgi:hypothetical protein
VKCVKAYPGTAALVLSLSAALVLASCGGSDDSGQDTVERGGSERQQARAAVDRLYDAMKQGDADGVCAQLSTRARKQIASGGLGSTAASCEASFQRFLDAAEKSGGLDLTLEAEVQTVRVDGDKATAKVTFGKDMRGDIPLVKEGGEWKLEAAGSTP